MKKRKLSLWLTLGCRKLHIEENHSPLKVVHRAEKPVQKVEQAFFFSPEKTRAGEYRYGFNGQEKDDEVAGEGNSNTAQFWQYDTRLARRWNPDPKPNPAISIYACFANNPLFYSDPLGDTTKFDGIRERVDVFIGKLFNKEFREKHRERKSEIDVYTYSRDSEFSKKSIRRADACEINCSTNVENGFDYSQNVIYYKKGIGLDDVSNGVARNVIKIGSFPIKIGWKIGKIGWSVGKLGVGVGIGLPTVAFRKWVLGQDVGWGMANRVEQPTGNHNRGLLAWGFGDYNNYNMFGGEAPGPRLGPSPHGAIAGVYVGNPFNKDKPIQTQFFEIGIGVHARNWKYRFSVALNLWKGRTNGKGPRGGHSFFEWRYRVR